MKNKLAISIAMLLALGACGEVDTSFVLMPGDGYKTTTVYELGAEGSSERLHTAGWATRLFRVR